MPRRSLRSSPARQAGWIGLIVLLLALVVVGLLAKTLLQQSGLSGAAKPASGAPAGTAAPTPRNAVDAAKELESAVHKQAEEAAKGMDDATK